MNRFKKEEARAHQKAREGLSDAEIKRLDEQDALNEKISGIARSIHAKVSANKPAPTFSS